MPLILHTYGSVMGYSIYGTGGHLGIPSRSCASCASATGAAASAGAAKARGAQLLGVPGVAMDGGFHGHGGTPKWIKYGEYMVDIWLIYG